jgi:hypothetical protein
LYEAVADFGFRDTTLHLLDKMALLVGDFD